VDKFKNIFKQAVNRDEMKKQLILAIDHGLSFPDMQGLEYPLHILEKISENEHISGLIASAGVFKQAQKLNISLEDKIKLLTIDIVSTQDYANGQILSQRKMIFKPEETLFLEPDVYKMFLNIYSDSSQLIENCRDFERFVAFGQKNGIYSLAEIMFFGNDDFQNPNRQAELLLKGCRLAMELGADALKIPMPSDITLLNEIYSRVKLPIYIMGGSKTDDTDAFVNSLSLAAKMPIFGYMLGRNVWQNEDMDEVISRIYHIINKKFTK